MSREKIPTEIKDAGIDLADNIAKGWLSQWKPKTLFGKISKGVISFIPTVENILLSKNKK